MSEDREDPEKILERIQQETREEAMGKLKVYLGAAPGVGKTYTMLQDALEKKAQGVDVVIGVVETHGRHEISVLVKDLEILPKKQIEYRDKKLLEFDLDAALMRNPGLILMDEMAHTNIPGLRHEKRWQDIKELLDRGIDVYTTLNVQHIESLTDKVSQLIHVPIKETIPDSMLELASSIELVDLPPEELLKRLEDGKVYFRENVQQAKTAYFRKINLIALRELALRVAAEHVAAAVVSYRKKEGIKEAWPTKETILVCVGSDVGSQRLIRVAKQIAFNAQADWMAVYVASPETELTEKQRSIAIQNLRFAEQLGARAHLITGLKVAEEIIQFANENNVTMIMVRKRIRSFWKKLFFKSLSDELVRHSGSMNIYVVMEKAGEKKSEPSSPKWSIFSGGWQVLRFYLIAIGVVIITTLVSMFMYSEKIFSLANILIIYFLGVVAVSAWGWMGPAVLASILSVITYRVLFVDPPFVLDFKHGQYIFTLLAFLITSQIISRVTISIRQQRKATRFAEHQRVAIYDLNHQLSNLVGIQKILEAGIYYVSQIFDSQVLALILEGKELTIKAYTGEQKSLTDKEQSIAHWVCKLGQLAGLGTHTLSSSDSLYIPLLDSKDALGVLKIQPHKGTLFTPEQMKLLESCTKQIALALEANNMHERKKQIEVQAEIERVRDALLQYLSEDLRVPLASLFVSVRSITTLSDELTPTEVEYLLNNIYAQAKELQRIINTLSEILASKDGFLLPSK